MADPIEELLQIKIDHPPVPVFQMPLGLVDRRVAAPAGTEPVARSAERRLVQRLEHLPHRLLNNPVDHVRDPQPALPASRLRDQRPTDHAGPVPPRQQIGPQLRTGDRPLLAQLLDRLPIRARGTPVRHHLQQRQRQPVGNLLHRHRRAVLCLADRLRHPRQAPSLRQVRGRRAGGPSRVFCCSDQQFELQHRLIDRDRLPSPTNARARRLSGHYPAFQYHAVLRLLLGHRPTAYRTSGPNRSPGVRR